MDEDIRAPEVEICGNQATSCGYCKSKKSSASYGLLACRLSCAIYQSLLDRGWRRSGTYLYRPINRKTCCPCYAIRVPAPQFHPTKTQRRLQRQIQQLLSGKSSKAPRPPSDVISSTIPAAEPKCGMIGTQPRLHKNPPNRPPPSACGLSCADRVLVEQLRAALLEATVALVANEPFNLVLQQEWLSRVQVLRDRRFGQTPKSPPSLAAAFCSPLPMQLQGLLRKVKASETTNSVTLGELLISRLGPLPTAVSGVFVAAPGYINFTLSSDGPVFKSLTETSESLETRSTGYKLGCRGSEIEARTVTQEQISSEASASPDLSLRAACSTAPQERSRRNQRNWQSEEGPLRIDMEPSRFDEESFALYTKYQRIIHGDSPEELTRRGYIRFLVQSPLQTEYRYLADDSVGVRHCVPQGSFHQLYRLAGKLIAVGVVDVLPNCLSSVYCFYDPDYSHLSLGKVTALCEIQWVQEVCQYQPSLQFYYLGFYIHTCPKMRYKGEYEPSELLCPSTGRWLPLVTCRPILDRCPRGLLESQPDGADVNLNFTQHLRPEGSSRCGAVSAEMSPQRRDQLKLIQEVPLDVGPFGNLSRRAQCTLAPILREYVDHVGEVEARRIRVKLAS